MYQFFKNVLLLLSFLILFFSFNNIVLAEDNNNYEAQIWTIKNYEAELSLVDNKKDTSILEERISANFNQEFLKSKNLIRHGIIRSFRLSDTDIYDYSFPMNLNIISIKDAKGKDYNYELSQVNNRIDIKIGDVNKILSENNYQYNLRYKIDHIWNYYNDAEKLYFNVTGNDWPVNIEKVKFILNLDKLNKIDWDKLKLKCYTGRLNSTESDCSFKKNIEDKKIIFTTNNILKPKEGFTIVVVLPKSTLPPVNIKSMFIYKGQFYLSIILALFAVLYSAFKWYREGRLGIFRAITPEYKAINDFSPLYLEFFRKFNVNSKMISGEILYLSSKKYISIRYEEKKSLLSKKEVYIKLLKKDFYNDDNLELYQKELLASLFDKEQSLANQNHISLKTFKFNKNKVFNNRILLNRTKENLLIKNVKEYADEIKVSDLKYQLSALPGHLKKILEEKFLEEAYIKDFLSVQSFKIHSLSFFTVLFLLAYILLSEHFNFLLANYFDIEMGIFYISFVIVFIFLAITKHLEKDALKYYYAAQGLYMYIKLAEKDRIAFAELENLFEDLLPYAVVFGVVTKWNSLMQKMYKDLDKESSNLGTDIALLGNFVNTVVDSFDSQISTGSHNSSTYGSSGSGAGGGGGSSW